MFLKSFRVRDSYVRSLKDSRKDLKIPEPVFTSQSTEIRFTYQLASVKRRVRSCSNFEILQRDFFVGTVDTVVVLVTTASALIRLRERVLCHLQRRRRCIGGENNRGLPEVVASVVSRSAVCANSLNADSCESSPLRGCCVYFRSSSECLRQARRFIRRRRGP